MNIEYFCKRCLGYMYFKILDTNTHGQNHDVAKIKCLHCEEPSFVIEYPKGESPSQTSKRVHPEHVNNDIQDEYMEGWRPLDDD